MTLRLALAAVLIVLSAGCAERRDDPPDGAFRFVHAAPTLGAAAFLLEERAQGSLIYTSGTGAQPLDSGPFDFNVELPADGVNELERQVRQAVTIEAERLHTLVLFDDGGPSLVDYVRDFPDVASGSAEIQLLHAARGAAAVDLYIEADGADLSAATPRSTLGFRDIGEPFQLPAGDYRLSLTVPGDPASVLFRSGVFGVADGGSYLLSVFATFGLSAADLRASLLERGSTQAAVINDSLVAPVFKVVHGGAGVGNVDVVVDGDFAAPVHADVAPGVVTAFADLTAGSRQFQVTPAGDMGVIEADVTQTLANGGIYAQVISGTAGDVDAPLYIDDNRGVQARARYRLRHAAANVPAVTYYLTEPGAGIVDATPVVTALQAGIAEFAATVLPGDYDLVFVENDGDAATEDTTVVAGPVPVTFDELRVYEIYLLDGAVAGEVEVSVTDVTAMP
ncbi:MAG: DUF4397 domain-containing protein [Pseudomonadota bacterium]